MSRKSKLLLATAIILAFCTGFVAAAIKKPAQGSFHDMIVNHPRELTTLITPRNAQIRSLAKELKTPENAFLYVRDRIANEPAMPAQPAGEILAGGKASCLGKAVLLASLYRAMKVPTSAVRVVTGEVESNGVIDHAWVEMEVNGSCLQQDSTNLLGTFSFNQFHNMDYSRAFIRREGYVFNDKHFAVVSRHNLLKGMGHPQIQ